jgi:hypothetical protein
MNSCFPLLSLALLAACSTTKSAVGVENDSKAQLELLSSLAGDWTGTAGVGDESFPVETSFRVTGHKSTVVETMFKGTEDEMVSMYHLDGTSLLHTHYCAAGNQPRMVALATEAHGQISFDFLDATNMKSNDEQHMHSMKIQVKDKDHIEEWWTAWKDGKADHTAHFVLTRKK